MANEIEDDEEQLFEKGLTLSAQEIVIDSHKTVEEWKDFENMTRNPGAIDYIFYAILERYGLDRDEVDTPEIQEKRDDIYFLLG